MLSAHVQRLAARHQQLEPCAVLQQLRHRRGGRRDLLEVVEDQQHLLVAQPVTQLVEERLGSRALQVDRARDRRDHRFRVARRGEVDEERPVLEQVELIGRRAKREPRLSDAARSRQRQ